MNISAEEFENNIAFKKNIASMMLQKYKMLLTCIMFLM